MTTYNVFENRDGLLYPTAVNVTAAELGDDMDEAFDDIEREGFARVGGGAAPMFHIEKCTNASADLDTVECRFEVESLHGAA